MLNKNFYDDKEYMDIISPYLENSKIKSLKNIPHHDSNRLDHSLKVSYLSYQLCKKYNLNYESAAKAGLLHDLYFNRIEECYNLNEKVKLFMNEHPEIAAKNAEELFGITPLEKDIIISHMWPATKHIPKHRESFVVGIADKIFSVKELGTKLNYNLRFMSGVYFIFLMYSLFK